MNKVYLVICESSLPGVYEQTIEDGFDSKDKAQNCVTTCGHDLITQCDKDEFYPEYFKDYEAILTKEYCNITSKKDSMFFIRYYVEEVEIH